MHDSGLGLSAIYDGLRILHTYIVWIATTSISEMAMMAAAVRWLGMKFVVQEGVQYKYLGAVDLGTLLGTSVTDS